jgi:hypothetical protein
VKRRSSKILHLFNLDEKVESFMLSYHYQVARFSALHQGKESPEGVQDEKGERFQGSEIMK